MRLFCENHGFRFLVVIPLFLLSLAEFLFGLFEIVIFGKYSNVVLSQNCSSIKNNLMGAYMTDLFMGFNLIYLCFALYFRHDIEEILEIGFKAHTFVICYDIVAAIFYSGEIKCFSEITEKTPDIWISILAHYISGLVIIWSLVIGLIIFGVIYIFISCKSNTTNHEEIELSNVVLIM